MTSTCTVRSPPIIGAQFFAAYSETQQSIFALLTFAAGFIVRPFGAIIFGRLGDIVGRKYTFVVTVVLMGAATFLVGLLPSYRTSAPLPPSRSSCCACCRV